ncbi:MAG: hypothetical protein K2G87_07400 [Oscillospiraceae bacterium]|nr:hypothetical protein [Oscillospiraceae bacterium]
MGKAKDTTHYKVQCLDEYGNVVDDCVEDMIFDDYDEAEDFALQSESDSAAGREILEFRYRETGDDEDCPGDYEYIVVEC